MPPSGTDSPSKDKEIDRSFIAWLLCINKESKRCSGRELMDDMFCHIGSYSRTQSPNNGFTDCDVIGVKNDGVFALSEAGIRGHGRKSNSLELNF